MGPFLQINLNNQPPRFSPQNPSVSHYISTFISFFNLYQQNWGKAVNSSLPTWICSFADRTKRYTLHRISVLEFWILVHCNFCPVLRSDSTARKRYTSSNIQYKGGPRCPGQNLMSDSCQGILVIS